MKVYRTQEIARLVNVHSNTVRLYEEWSFISSVPREQNGYRRFSEVHLLQMQIARLAFRQEFIQNDLRRRATRLVRLSGKEKFSEALKEAQSYLQHLRGEHRNTLQAIESVGHLLKVTANSFITYTHHEMSKKLQLSEETLRNWERNGLYEIARDNRNRRIYTEKDFYKLLIIRTLRSAHFSIASIRNLFDKYIQDQQLDIGYILNSPRFTEDFLHVTDQLELNLRRAMKDVEEIIALLNKSVS